MLTQNIPNQEKTNTINKSYNYIYYNTNNKKLNFGDSNYNGKNKKDNKMCC